MASTTTPITTPTFDEDKLLRIKETAELTGFSSQFIMASTRRDPKLPFVRVGEKCVRFRRSDIRSWIEALAAKKPSR
jgi:excisionase family DNA binding protein